MTTSNLLDQFCNDLPPRVTAVVAQAVDATSRHYDLTVLQLVDEALTVAPGGQVKNEVRLLVQAESNSVYVAFYSDGTKTIDDTNINTAGTAWTKSPSSTASAPAVIPAGTSRVFRIDRQVDKQIYLKCSGTNTATARIYQLSQSLPGATSGQ